MKRLTVLLFVTATFLLMQTTLWSQGKYVWNGSSSALWTEATNWTPNRTTPLATDTIWFNGGSPTVSNVPAGTIAILRIFNNASVNLLPASPGNELTVNNPGSTDLSVESPCELQIGSGLTLTSTYRLANNSSIGGSGTLKVKGVVSGSGSYTVSVTFGGSGYCKLESNMTITGNVTVDALTSVYEWGDDYTLTVNGTLTNEGTIRNYEGHLTVNVTGDVVNNGTWKNLTTEVQGTFTNNGTIQDGGDPTTITVNGSIVNNGTWENSTTILNGPGNMSATMSFNTDLTIASGKITLTSNVENNRDITIDGELVVGADMTYYCYADLVLNGKLTGTSAETSGFTMGGDCSVDLPTEGTGATVSQLSLAAMNGWHYVYFSGICNLELGASFEIDNNATMQLAGALIINGGTINLNYGVLDMCGNQLTLNEVTLNIASDAFVDDSEGGSPGVLTQGNSTINLGGWFYVPLEVSGTTTAASAVEIEYRAEKSAKAAGMSSLLKGASKARTRKVASNLGYYQFTGGIDIDPGAVLTVPAGETLSIDCDMDVVGATITGGEGARFAVDSYSYSDYLYFDGATISVPQFYVITYDYDVYVEGSGDFTGSTIYLDESWIALSNSFTMTGGKLQLPSYAGVDLEANALTLVGVDVSIAASAYFDDATYYLAPQGTTLAKGKASTEGGVVITEGTTSIEQGGDFYVPLQVNSGTTTAWNVEAGSPVNVPLSVRKTPSVGQIASVQQARKARRTPRTKKTSGDLTYFDNDITVMGEATLSIPPDQTLLAAYTVNNTGKITGPGQFFFDSGDVFANNGTDSADTFFKLPSGEYTPQIAGDGVWSNLTFEGSVDMYENTTVRSSNITNYGTLDIGPNVFSVVNSTFTNTSDATVRGGADSFETDSTVSIIQNGSFDETLKVIGGTTTAKGVFSQPIIVKNAGTLNIAAGDTLLADDDVTVGVFEEVGPKIRPLARVLNGSFGRITGAGDLWFNGSSFTNNGEVDAKTTFLGGGYRYIDGEGGKWNSLTVAVTCSTSVDGAQSFTGAGTPFVINGTANFESGSTITYAGTSPQVITPLTYCSMEINNPAGVTLPAPVTVNTALYVTSGDLATGTNTLTLASGATVDESGGMVIGNLYTPRFGTVGVKETFGGIGLSVTPQSFTPPAGADRGLAKAALPGDFTMEVTRKTGTAPTVTGVTALKRSFDVAAAVGSLNGDLAYHYKPGELNGTTETALSLFNRQLSGDTTWYNRGGTVDVTGDSISISGVDPRFRWTAGQCAPTLTSISPTVGRQGTTLTDTLNGSNFVNGATSVVYSGTGVTVNSVTFSSAAKVIANITISGSATVGLRDVSVTTGGGTAMLASAFQVKYPAPTLTSISPATGVQGTTLSDTLKGSNFVNAVTTVTYSGTGITINSVSFPLAMQGVANITIAAGAPLGMRDVSVITGVDTAKLLNAFQVTGSSTPPTLTSISPTAGEQGTKLAVTLTGSNFVNGGTTVAFSGTGDVTVDSVKFTSATQVIAYVSISTSAAVGAHSVSVTTAGGTATLTSAFQVNYPTPVLTSISPTSGSRGGDMNVFLYGTGFMGSQSTVSLGDGITVNDVSGSSTTLTVGITITAGASLGTRTVSVNNPTPGGGSTSLSAAFTVVNPVPQISSVSPSSGVRGKYTTVTVTGNGFYTGATSLDFGSEITLDSVVVLSTTQIRARALVSYAASTGARNVSVTNAAPGGGSATLSSGFTVSNPVPGVSAISPVSGARGKSVPVTITGTDFIIGVTSPSLGAGITASPVAVVSPTQMTATLAIGRSVALGARDLTVTNAAPGGGPATLPGAFSVQNPVPTLASIAPATATIDQTLDIVLTGTDFFTGATTADFGAGITVNSTTIDTTGTHLTANVKIAAAAVVGTRSVTVTNGVPGGGSATLAGALTVGNPVPTISSVSPNVGGKGQTMSVAIVGTNFIQGVTSADFGLGIVVSSVTVNSPTTLTASIAIDPNTIAAARSVSVINAAPGGGKATLSFVFNVQNLAPTIASVSPASGARGENATVTITGTNFSAGSTTVDFGAGVTVNSTTVTSPTQMTANLSIPAGTTLGARDVAVTNPPPGGGTATLTGGYLVGNPLPTVASVSPATGFRTQNLTVTVTGTGFFSGATSVSFGPNIDVTSVAVVSTTQLTATIAVTSAAATGARNVSATNLAPGGGTGSLTNGFSVTNPVPTVASITPTSALRGSSFGVTVTGTQFISGVTSLSLGADITVSGLVVNSPASLQANVALGTASAGAKDVTVTNAPPGGGSATLSGGFTVNNPVPTLTSVAPTSAGRGSLVNVTVTGTDFVTGVTASFGADVTVTNTSVKSPTELLVSISISSAASLGTRVVSVTNPVPGGGTATLPTGFTVSSALPTGLEGNLGVIPDQYVLQEAYPNPFNPSTRIRYGIPEDSRVELVVHNMLGNVVAQLVNGERSKGTYELAWHADYLPSGVYLIRIQAESIESTKRFLASRKVVLVK